MNEILWIKFEDIGTAASIIGLLISLLIFLKSRTIEQEVILVKNKIILKKRLPEILQRLNENLSYINKLLIDIEKNETKIKGRLVECQSIIVNLLCKIHEYELNKDLCRVNKAIKIVMIKTLSRDPSELKIVKQFMAQYRLWPYSYEYNLLSIKHDLSKIYNDLDNLSLDQKEI